MIVRQVLYLSCEGDSRLQAIKPLDRLDAFLVEVPTVERALDELATSRYQLFISRAAAFDRTQEELLRFLINNNVPTRMIIVARSGSIEHAVQAVKMGAVNFILKDHVDSACLESIIRSGMDIPSIPRGHAADNGDAGEDFGLIGRSKAIADVRAAIQMVSKSPAAVLIVGESGTGKEIVARTIHLESLRKSHPFIAINCAALPRDVIENELFGHEKGAFTGALAKKCGAFEQATGGTLFFDEFAEMNAELQAKLLRAIENKSFRRLGGNAEISVDVRVIAATNKDIPSALASGELREDLYHRFSVIEINLPPLRERSEDIPPLIDNFLEIFALQYAKPRQRFSDECLEILRTFRWPGNVRELRNVVERAVVTCQDELISPEYLPARISQRYPAERSVVIPIGSTFEEVERRVILRTLECYENNKSKAAKVLGLSRRTLHNKLHQFHLQNDEKV